MQFAITCLDQPNSLALRQATRAAHLEHAAAHRVVLGGPLLDSAGSPIGSLLIVEADTREQAEQIAAADQYAHEEILASLNIKSFRTVLRGGVLT